MKSLIRLTLAAGIFAATAGVLPHALQSHATACPSCKNANETDSRRPTAYMYSILFMLGMPATIFSCFGIAFYRMSRREMLAEQDLPAGEQTVENS
jgi:hypothetical protein